MANPEKIESGPPTEDEDLGMGNALAAPDGNNMSNEIFGANEHDILWIDAVTDASATDIAGATDWTQSPDGDNAAQAAEQWIALDDKPTGEDALFENGLTLTSIDGLPW